MANDTAEPLPFIAVLLGGSPLSLVAALLGGSVLEVNLTWSYNEATYNEAVNGEAVSSPSPPPSPLYGEGSIEEDRGELNCGSVSSSEEDTVPPSPLYGEGSIEEDREELNSGSVSLSEEDTELYGNESPGYLGKEEEEEEEKGVEV